MIPDGKSRVLVAVGCAALTLFSIGCATSAEDRIDREHALAEPRVQVQWRLALAADRGWETNPREMGTPVVTPGGDLLVGASNGWVYRVISHSGEHRWATPVDASIDAAAQLADRTVYVGTDAAELVALNWSDGQEQWRHQTRGSVEARPTVADGRVFVTDSDDWLYAVDAATGERIWDFRHQPPEFFTIKGGGQPLVVDDVVYSGFADGYLVALHADTGDEIWSVHLGDETGEFGDIDLPLYDYDDRLIATSYAGGIYAVDKDTGALEWHVDRNNLSGVQMVGGWLLATSADGEVFAVDTRDGEINWDRQLPDGHSASDLSTVEEFVVVATSDGPIYWLDLATGRVNSGWKPSSGFQSAPVFDNRLGYVMSNRGYLYGFGLAY